LVKERLRTLVEFDAVGVARHDDLQELLRVGEGVRLVHPDGVNVVGEGVADRPCDHVAFLVDFRRRLELLDAADDDLPEARQVSEIALQFLLVFVHAGRADDKAEALRRLGFVGDFTQPAALFVVRDLARHADAIEAWNQHKVASGNADIGAERWAFGADAFLDDLHQHFLAAAKNVLDEGLGPAHAGASTHAPPAGTAAPAAPAIVV